MKTFPALVALFLVVGMMALAGSVTSATTGCIFTTVGTTNTLDADCTTDATISIPDGFTLDGNNNTITAVDPAGDHFRGAVVANAGTTAHVKNLTVEASGLANACDAGADRLRGIMFDGASGSITHSNVLNINQGASGCQEGNAIEVRNAPFVFPGVPDFCDPGVADCHPDTQTVEIAHNTVDDYQKTGIVCNGDVDCNIHHNNVGDSATQANLAANSIQFGFGAMGSAMHNNVEGNQWLGNSCFVATAFLIFLADGVNASFNQVRGNSEVGMYLLGNAGVYNNNTVFDEGVDSAVHDCSDFGLSASQTFDIGIGDYDVFTPSGADDNTVRNNVVRGFDTPYDGVSGGRNITVPGPQPSSDAF